MIDVIYNKKGIRIRHIWFCHEMDYMEILKNKKYDIALIHGYSQDVNAKNLIMNNQLSLKSDLKVTEEEVFEKFGKYCKKKIKRAIREENDIRFFLNESIPLELLPSLSHIYEEMYKSKGIKRHNFNEKLLRAYIKAKNVMLAVAYKDNEPFGFCTYLFSEGCAREWSSAFAFREGKLDANYVGRIHRYLKWESLLTLKKIGIGDYDWGGITSYETPNGIDTFKMEFGGELTTYSNIYIPGSLVGRIILNTYKRKL